MYGHHNMTLRIFPFYRFKLFLILQVDECVCVCVRHERRVGKKVHDVRKEKQKHI